MHLFGTLCLRPAVWLCVLSSFGAPASERYCHNAGQKVARLERHKSLCGDVHRSRTLWVRTISLLLFNAPIVHLHALEKNSIDGLTQEIPWTRFVTDIKQEWVEAAIAVGDPVVILHHECSCKRDVGHPASECEHDIPLCRRHRYGSWAQITGANREPDVCNRVHIFRLPWLPSVSSDMCKSTRDSS